MVVLWIQVTSSPNAASINFGLQVYLASTMERMGISPLLDLKEYLFNIAWTQTCMNISFLWSLGNQDSNQDSQWRAAWLVSRRHCLPFNRLQDNLQRVGLSHRHLEEQATSWSAARSCKTSAKFTVLMRSEENLESNINSHHRLPGRCVSTITSNILDSNRGYQSTRNIAVHSQSKRFVFGCSKNDAAFWLLSFLFARSRMWRHSNRCR